MQRRAVSNQLALLSTMKVLHPKDFSADDQKELDKLLDQEAEWEREEDWHNEWEND